MRHPGMNAQQRLGVAVADLNRRGVDPHHDLAADRRGPRGVITAVDPRWYRRRRAEQLR